MRGIVQDIAHTRRIHLGAELAAGATTKDACDWRRGKGEAAADGASEASAEASGAARGGGATRAAHPATGGGGKGRGGGRGGACADDVQESDEGAVLPHGAATSERA